MGGIPALLVAFIRNNVKEPERWENRREELREKWTMHHAFFLLFSPQYRRRTIFNSIYLIVSLVGLWAGSVYVPAAMTYIAAAANKTAVEAAQLASYSTALLGIGTVLGALLVPLLADRLGRKLTLGIFFALMGFSIWLAFGHVFYMEASGGRARGSWCAPSFWGWAARILSCTRSGCRSSTGPNAAPARSRSTRMSAALRRRA